MTLVAGHDNHTYSRLALVHLKYRIYGERYVKTCYHCVLHRFANGTVQHGSCPCRSYSWMWSKFRRGLFWVLFSFSPNDQPVLCGVFPLQHKNTIFLALLQTHSAAIRAIFETPGGAVVTEVRLMISHVFVLTVDCHSCSKFDYKKANRYRIISGCWQTDFHRCIWKSMYLFSGGSSVLSYFVALFLLNYTKARSVTK